MDKFAVAPPWEEFYDAYPDLTTDLVHPAIMKPVNR